MPKTVLLDEWHVTFRIPTTLSDADVRAARRVWGRKAFAAAVRRVLSPWSDFNSPFSGESSSRTGVLQFGHGLWPGLSIDPLGVEIAIHLITTDDDPPTDPLGLADAGGFGSGGPVEHRSHLPSQPEWGERLLDEGIC